MGLPIVLMFWAAAGGFLALLAAILLVGLTLLLTRGRGPRKALIAFAAALPFVSLCWAACVFTIQAVVNELLMGRDIGLGDGFHCPLPNGYTISMIDVLDYASLLDAPHGQPVVYGVRQLQVTERYVLGVIEPRPFGDVDLDSVDKRYFLLDSATNQISNVDSLRDLEEAAARIGERLELESAAAIYSRYRLSWFDYLATFVTIAPQVAGFCLLVVRTWRFRRTHKVAASGVVLPDA